MTVYHLNKIFILTYFPDLTTTVNSDVWIMNPFRDIAVKSSTPRAPLQSDVLELKAKVENQKNDLSAILN